MYVVTKTVALLLATACMTLAQPTPVLRVDVAKPVAEIQPTMWGVFFEDINFGADGGIYAEMVKNRSFEFFKPLMGWKVEGKKRTEGDVLVQNRGDEKSSNPRYLRVTTNNAATGDLSLTNEGFRGMGIKKGLRYDFAMLYRYPSAGQVTMRLDLLNAKNEVIGTGILKPGYATPGQRQKAQVSFT